MSENGWNESADAWIADMGKHGDFGRRYVLDPVMAPRALAAKPQTMLDVGCGEGRFCRMLGATGIACTGIDPTRTLLEHARERDPRGIYIEASGNALPVGDASFDLVVSYLSLLDMPEIGAPIAEMARVLKPWVEWCISVSVRVFDGYRLFDHQRSKCDHVLLNSA